MHYEAHKSRNRNGTGKVVAVSQYPGGRLAVDHGEVLGCVLHEEIAMVVSAETASAVCEGDTSALEGLITPDQDRPGYYKVAFGAGRVALRNPVTGKLVLECVEEFQELVPAPLAADPAHVL